MCNVPPTCAVDVPATEAIQVLKKNNHVAVLKWRLETGKNGKPLQLLREVSARQSRKPKAGAMKNINVVSRKFHEYMSKGNVN